jgi:hypothetical protein
MFLWGVEYSDETKENAAENKEYWDNKLYPRFKDFYDRALIAHHICEHLYGKEACVFDDEKFSKFDDR